MKEACGSGLDRRQRQKEAGTAAAGIGNDLRHLWIYGCVAQPGANAVDNSAGLADLGAGLQIDVKQKLITVVRGKEFDNDVPAGVDDQTGKTGDDHHRKRTTPQDELK